LKVKNQFWMNLSALGLVIGIAACTSSRKQEAADREASTKPSQEALIAANENDAAYVAEIRFQKGSTTLTPQSRAQLANLVQNAKSAGKIDDIKVITWADMEYPSVNTTKLSQAQRKLAEDRNKEIEKYLETSDRDLDIDSYNMAERPGVLSRLLSTENSRIKKSLEVAGIPNTDSAVKIPSKASRSMVMVILE
jgi:hypothetical protein